MPGTSLEGLVYATENSGFVDFTGQPERSSPRGRLGIKERAGDAAA